MNTQRARAAIESLAQRRMVSRDAPHQGLIIGLATAVVVIGAIVSATSLDLGLSDLDYRYLGLALLTGFTVVPLNAMEFRLSSELHGKPIAMKSAVHTTVLASALNILPLPAGAMVRFQGLREGGASSGGAAAAIGALGSIWLTVSSTFAAIMLASSRRWTLAAIFLVACVAFGALSWLILRGRSGSKNWLARVVALEACFVALAALRFFLTMSALGVDVSLTQASVIASSSSLASAAGVLPGSIGVFEFLAAGLAAVVDLPASAGFLATALLRLMAAIVSAVAGLTMMRSIRRERPQPDAGSAM